MTLHDEQRASATNSTPLQSAFQWLSNDDIPQFLLGRKYFF